MNQKPPTYRIDEQVFLTMAAICVVALLILAFRFAGRKPCPTFVLESSAKEYYVGDVAQFKTGLANASSYEWSFGDDSVETGSLVAANHIYRTAGFYTVTLTINGSCEEYLNIHIKQKPIPTAPPKVQLGCGDTAWVGEPFQFYDLSSGATSREWRFGETAGIDSREEQPVYTYYNKGPKTVQLTINGKTELTVSKRILVLERKKGTTTSGHRPATGGRPTILPRVQDTPTAPPLVNPTPVPVDPTPAPPKIIEKLELDKIEAKIHHVIDKKSTPADLLPYVCETEGTLVTYDGKTMPFSQFMTKIESFTRRQAKRVHYIQITKIAYSSTNCIKSMTVVIHWKGIFG